MKNIFTICFFLLFFSFQFGQLQACDRAALYLDEVQSLGNNQYQITMTFCAGAGQTDRQRGADQHTGPFGFFISGGASVIQYPATLISPQTGFSYVAYTARQDTVLVYDNQTWWWACITGDYWGYSCGPVQTVCETITIVTQGLPQSIEILGLEGGGNILVGCQGEKVTVYPPTYDGNSQNPCASNSLAVNTSADRSTIHLGYDSNNCVNLSGLASGGSGTCDVTWSTGASGHDITVCPTETTTYTFTATDRICGYQQSGSITVEVVDVRCGRRNNRVELCHNNRRKCVSRSKAQQLIAQGAELGNCNNSNRMSQNGGWVNAAAQIETETISLDILPNPTVDRSRIILQTPMDTEIEVVMLDMNGRVVRKLYTGPSQQHTPIQIEMDRNELPAGLYFLRLSSVDGSVQTKKWILR